MVTETTWGNAGHQTQFEWTVTTYGIVLDHGTNAPYSIPWKTFAQVLTQARSMASTNGNQIAAGVDQNNPSPGSVGAWVFGQNLPISQGQLTPKHLSFIGPILGRMGIATNTLKGKAIIWHF
jgi:hypothetical protein